MENVIIGRIVHMSLPVKGRADRPVCRPLLITDVHTPETVSGQLFLSPFNDQRNLELPGVFVEDARGGWVTSVVEEKPRTQGPGDTDKREPHLAQTWHDPRLC